VAYTVMSPDADLIGLNKIPGFPELILMLTIPKCLTSI